MPDARNLAVVILHLMTRRRGRYNKLNGLLRYIFPSVEGVSTEVQNKEARLMVRTIDPNMEFSELAMDLDASGTGIGQAIAMLTVLVSADNPRILVVDEPNSFLHPSAVRKLIQIFRDSPHQFIVTTHSPGSHSVIETFNVALHSMGVSPISIGFA